MMEYLPAITSALGVFGTKADIEADNEALMANMGNQAESFAYSQNVKGEQLDDIDRALGDKLSASALDSLKRESRLKASSAETGATGGSNDEAIMTAQMDKLHRDDAIMRTSQVQKKNNLNSMVAERLGFENTIEGMVSGMTSSTSALLQTLSGGAKGLNTGMSFLSNADLERFFGTNTKGTSNG